MPLRSNKLESILKHKFNFSRAVNHSSDHKWYELKLSGIPTIFTKISHGRSDISSEIESKIAKQLKVRKQFFRGMVNCDNNSEEYCNQVTKDPFPPWDIPI